ncbi:EpsG family protein [Pedobacter cryoconitis]|uniref:EpsG family protein n=1 Tax=Pedobacter cryoconitis TaxID=188932 RepID=UPI0016150D75|nr:EpsG family protein [Pedobacter cryoconitis]MBB5647477.1 hypothetical protein [Pedobacter cryoconitis]
MLIYYLVFLFSFLLCGFDYLKDQSVKLIVYVAFSAFLIALPAFRTIGTDNDSGSYEEIFLSGNKYSLAEVLEGKYEGNTERGYMLLNKVILMMGGDINTLLFVVAVLTGVLNYTLIYKVSKFPFTALLIYLSFFYLYRDFTQIRYALSCAFAYWTVFFFIRGRYFSFFFSFMVAMLFHNTAFALIVILPLCYFFKNRYIYMIIPFFCLIGIFVNPFPILLSLGGVPEHMQMYLDEDGAGGLAVSAIGLSIMLIYFIYYNKFEKKDSGLAIYYRLLAVGVSLSLLFIQASILQRFSYLFFQFCVLLLPNMLSGLQRLKDRYYFVLLHFLFNCFFLYYGVKLIAPTLIRPYF